VLPLAAAPGAAQVPGAPAVPVAGGGQAARQPSPTGAGTRAAAAAGPAARGPDAERGRAPQPRQRRAPLAPAEVDRIVDKVQRRLLHRLAIEGERRGTGR
jgi:hypothetical protein